MSRVDTALLDFCGRFVRLIRSKLQLTKQTQAHSLNLAALAMSIFIIDITPSIDGSMVRISFIFMAFCIALLVWGADKVKELKYRGEAERVARIGSVFYLLKKVRGWLAVTTVFFALFFVLVPHYMVILMSAYFLLLSGALYVISVESGDREEVST